MENQPQANPPQMKKVPTINGRVAGLSFVVLVIILLVLPQILMFTVPSLLFSNKIPHLMDGIIALVALIVGLVEGYKVKNNAFFNGLATGVVAMLFSQIGVSINPGLQSIIAYSLILTLPVVVGAMIGGVIKKSRSV